MSGGYIIINKYGLIILRYNVIDILKIRNVINLRVEKHQHICHIILIVTDALIFVSKKKKLML